MAGHMTTLAEAVEKLRAIREAPSVRATGEWSLGQVFAHCAQSIEYSMAGYPKLKPAIVRKTAGKLVARKFIRQGFMQHDLASTVPGAPEISAGMDMHMALDRLLAAIEAFNDPNAPLAPHFVFGNLSHADYDQLHAMHIANHLHEVKVG